MRTVLVTGATRGIGLALARQFNSLDYQVVGIARHDMDFPGTLYHCDLNDATDVQSCLTKIASEYSINVLVNNVGIASDQGIEDLDSGEFERVIRLNLWAPIHVAKEILPRMMAKRQGSVVNISSVVARGASRRTSYAGSKAAVEAVTRCWAIEAAPYGVNVNCIAPGPTNTELFRKFNPPGSVRAKSYLERIPMGRFADPQEIAQAACFLSSDAARYITGQVITVDGGYTLT